MIVEMPDGGWAAFEIKLGASTQVVDGAAADLIALRDKVDAPPPLALGVITGSGYGIVRKDGVLQPDCKRLDSWRVPPSAGAVRPGAGCPRRWAASRDPTSFFGSAESASSSGSGRPLFPDTGMATGLRLVDSRPTGSGTANHVYQPTGRPEFGEIDELGWRAAGSAIARLIA